MSKSDSAIQTQDPHPHAVDGKLMIQSMRRLQTNPKRVIAIPSCDAKSRSATERRQSRLHDE
jgi:hypothetical protein